VFVTAYDEFALKAFELAALDYLLKPVTDQRLARCVERLKARLQRPLNVDSLVSQLKQIVDQERAASIEEPLRVLRAGIGDTVKMIPVEEVCYFQASDKYTTVVTKDGEALIRTPPQGAARAARAGALRPGASRHHRQLAGGGCCAAG